MKKGIFGSLICAMLICAMVASMGISALAAQDANVKDTDYYIQNATTGTWKTTNGRYKTNNSKVYVYPSESPSGYTYVATMCYVDGFPTNATVAEKGYVRLRNGYKYAITNLIYEDGDPTQNMGVQAWLCLQPTAGTGTLRGVWSPDWTGKGDVTII